MRLFSHTALPYAANIIGIDPGSQTLGLAVITFDVRDLSIISSQAQTFTASKMPGMNEWDCEIHNQRFSRINTHYDNILTILHHYQPIQVSCESPFYNPRMPMAFEVLVETMNAIRRATHAYDPWRHLYLVEPSTVKNAVGAKGGADKIGMKQAVGSLRGILKIINDQQYDYFDEHSIDALAVAYARYSGLCQSNYY